jgi:alkylation response protein AidB-like acyl-CoA dehydrogenase
MNMTAVPIGDADPALEQRRMLRESAQGFAARELSPGRIRALRGQAVQFDRELWKHMAELGWTGLLLPEQHGGYGLTVADALAVLEELGRPLLPEPLVAAAIFGGGLIARGDNEALKAELLPALAAGDLIPGVAWQEGLRAFGNAPGAFNNPPSAFNNTPGAFNGVSCRAEAAAGGYKLNGDKRYVRPGAGCDGFVVSAQAQDPQVKDGLALFWVPAKAAGLTIQVEKSTDGSDVAHLTLRNVEVKAAHVIAGPRAGRAAFDGALDETLLACGAEMLGLMRGALDLTLGYLRTRVQFGKPIGSFQALQHRAVDLYIQQELAAAAIEEAAAQFETAQPAERAALASRVKARCSDAAMLITREAIQLHGAIGFTDEYDIGFYLKRALALSAWLGNATEHRKRYAQHAAQVTAHAAASK